MSEGHLQTKNVSLVYVWAFISGIIYLLVSSSAVKSFLETGFHKQVFCLGVVALNVQNKQSKRKENKYCQKCIIQIF